MAKRPKEEAMEGLQTIPNDASDSKFQDAQQVQPSTPVKGKVESGSFVPEKKKLKGSELRTEVAARTVKDATLGGSNAGDGVNFGGRSVSGSNGGVLGAANATPIAGKSRSDTRYGKKLDRHSTKINFIPCDQILVEYDESKPLADAADQDQGFNGTYRNEFGRSQKRLGNVPGELMFDRSIDEISKDQLYFGQGQVVNQDGVTRNDYVTRCSFLDSLGRWQNSEVDNYFGAIPGNYLTRAIHLAVDSYGIIRYMWFDEDNYLPEVDAEGANKSSVAALTLMNDAELVRESIDSKAGDEKADVWSCLARAIAEPTATVGLLRDIEAETGNELVTAYRKATTSFSYQLNRAHKDGQDIVQPAIEALAGLQHNFVSKAYAKTQLGTSVSDLFNGAKYKSGCASLMIALYDSTGKYNNKADLILQPRGLRMHLQTADNNLDPFYCDKRFVQAYDAIECFSTIDHEYDPLSPIYMTDKAAVIHRYSWNAQYSYIRNNTVINIKKETATSGDTLFTIIPGAFMPSLVGKYLHVVGNADDHIEHNDISIGSTGAISVQSDNKATAIQIIINDSSTSLTPADYSKYDYVAEITDDMTSIRIPANVVIDCVCARGLQNKIFEPQCGPYTYKYSDLRNNYAVTVFHPLLKGFEDYIEEAIGGKLFSLIGSDDLTINTVHSTKFFSLWSFMLCAATPYIVKARINSYRDVLYYEKNVEYPFTSTLVKVKDVTTKSYSNFGYTDYDTELECKVMGVPSKLRWIMPELLQSMGSRTSDSVTYDAVLLPWYVSENEIYIEDSTIVFDTDKAAMSMPSIRSGVRFGPLDDLYAMTEKDIRLSFDMVSDWYELATAYYNGNTGSMKYGRMTDGQVVLGCKQGDVNIYSFLSLPRQLGRIIDAPYGLLTPKYNDQYATASDSVLGVSGYKATYWLGKTPVECATGEEAILDAKGVNVERAANFSQDWYAILASGTTPPVDHGFVLSANQLLADNGSLIQGRAYYHPFLAGDDADAPMTTGMAQVISLQKYLWTRLQKLQFVISPFDAKATVATNTYVFDPFDLMYAFGLAGFRASDFRESVYNREKEFVNQGILFVNDPWMTDSPLFKEGAAASGITVTEGFELK